MHGLVVLTGTARFRTVRPQGVLDVAGVVRHIQPSREDVLTAQQMAWCGGRLACHRQRLSRQTDVAHHASLTRQLGDVP